MKNAKKISKLIIYSVASRTSKNNGIQLYKVSQVLLTFLRGMTVQPNKWDLSEYTYL